ncbi:unnamed protein product [Polarella glacialis]|uniref:Aspartate carbamoyltransferase n=1 Tax=Polarella glacialis TaxID=89957 RepID=A0A813HTG7_POLGL|nr:unnamed protein product [Polarella glacialis]
MAADAGYPGKGDALPALGALAGRTVHVVKDLSLSEQLYLYERTRRLKVRKTSCQLGGSSSIQALVEPLCEVPDADEDEKVENPDSTVYLLFMEGSTRTRESLRNAAVFHGVKVNEFQAESSSFQKNETITDTMKMLAVYSTERSVFVIRSPLEGVCSALQGVMEKHAARFGIPTPAFLNAGDGQHAHPLGEMVDIYSLLEKSNWNRSEVHLALVGDLAHGRTAHSKVEGLKVFHKVKVDLVAPDIFSYPVEFKNRMVAEGFEVREFKSVEEYLRQPAGYLADKWYFYKPQFAKCGDLGQAKVEELRSQVSFRSEWHNRLPKSACFFQTLPRDKEFPLIPLSLDDTAINGWDTVAANAYFLDVILLGMLFGKIGKGLPTGGSSARERLATAEAVILPRSDVIDLESADLPSFMKSADLTKKDHTRDPKRAGAGGPVPITDGLIIDHIGLSRDAKNVWQRLRMVRSVLGWSKYIGSEGVYVSTKKAAGLSKGIMTLPSYNLESLKVMELKILASVAPGCTINFVAGSKVVAKYRLEVPERIYNLPNISCRNGLCVSNPKNKQRDVYPYFERVPFYQSSVLSGGKEAEFLFTCKYCSWPHFYESIFEDASL